MGSWESMKQFFGFVEEDAADALPEPSSAKAIPAKSFSGAIVNPNSQKFPGMPEIRVEEPRIYEDSLTIASHLRESKPVIINLKYLDNDAGKRLIDFICGTAYAINGHMMKIGENIFLFTPSNIQITDSSQNSTNSVSEKDIEDTPVPSFFKTAS